MHLAYGFLKEIVSAVIMFCKDAKVMVLTLEIDTDFEFVAGVLQEDTLELYSFIPYLDYVLQTSKDLIKEMVSH